MNGTEPLWGFTAREAVRAWRDYRRSRRRARRALRWRVLVAAGRELFSWDLLAAPVLNETIRVRCASLSFFVPARRGGVALDAGGRTRVLPLGTHLLPAADEASEPAGSRATFLLGGGPWVVASRRMDAGGTWRLQARFRERSVARAARLGFRRLAPAAGTVRRLWRLAVESGSA
ncbi:MAG TPA: hypothetical protein VGE98_02390, partial [Thermoanaerobaculia bacterium]